MCFIEDSVLICYDNCRRVDKMKKVFKTFKFISLSIIVLFLVVAIYNTSYSLISNSIVDSLGINEETSSYISFNYSSNSNHIVEIDNLKVISDFRGKRMFRKNYFDFEVVVPEDYNLDKDISYDIVFSPMSREIDFSFIKVYLTDQNNKAAKGYEGAVPVLSAFSLDNSGKVIYTGVLGKNNLKDKYRLRVWVSKDYRDSITEVFAYEVKVNLNK